MKGFDETTVSIVMLYRREPPYETAGFQGDLAAALGQDQPLTEVIVVDDRGAGAELDFAPEYIPRQDLDSTDSVSPADVDFPRRDIERRDFARADFASAAEQGRLRHVAGDFATRAAMFNAGIQAARGDYVLLLFNDRARVTLRRSAARTMVMAATRGRPVTSGWPVTGGRAVSGGRPVTDGRPATLDAAGGARAQECSADFAGMVYADYERAGLDGAACEVHLLDWHAGRLRDSFDFGSAVLLRTSLLRELGGFDERYAAADWYDLRLRVTERCEPVHIANRFAGSLYAVSAPAEAFNVFAYLLADRASQIEMERACTEHLKRIGAYLAPGAHVERIEYTAEEEQRFADCVASVVTPVYRRPEFIGRAIESVQAQSERRVEMIVVVNGGESDPTAAETRRYLPGGDRYEADKPPVRLLVTDVNNLGLCLNAGIAAARGKYYVQLDSDDRLKPDAVERILGVFESDATIGMAVGSYEVWTLGADGRLTRNAEIPAVTHPEWTAENGRNNLLRINGAGAPRAAHIKAIRAAGWFGVNDAPHCRNYGEDYDLVLRISERHGIGRVWEPIYEVIRHAGGTDHSIDQATIDRNDEAKDGMRAEALRRRRALNGMDARG